MSELWTALDWFEKTYWIIAIPFSLVFIVQLALSFMGADGADGVGDADFDGDLDGGDLSEADSLDDGGGAGFQIFTIRNFVSFFTIFGWAGITFIRNGATPIVTLIASVIIGLMAMFAVASLFYFFSRMVESGTMNIHKAVGKVGEVYIPIKANKGNIGKVQVNIQGSLREMSALTEDNEDLPTRTVVKVTEIQSDNILIVKKA